MHLIEYEFIEYLYMYRSYSLAYTKLVYYITITITTNYPRGKNCKDNH